MKMTTTATAPAYIFRVFTPTGRFRVTLPADATLKQLYRQVAEVCGVERTKISLYREQNFHRHVRHTGSVTLEQSELETGQMLYVKYSDDEVARTADDALEERAKQHIEPPRLPEAAPGTLAAPGAKFLPFDEYLRSKTSFDTSMLPLSQSFQSVRLVRGGVNKVPATATLMHQQYRHVDHVEFANVGEIRSFVEYWTNELQGLQQRCGWLFGYYVADPHYPLGIKAVVEGIYDPPQECVADVPVMLPTEEPVAVRRIAEALGLELVGWIFTHAERDVLLAPAEIFRIAELQLEHSSTAHFTGYRVSPFLTVTVSLDAQKQPGTNAFQVSDLGMALVRDGLLAAPSSSDTKMRLRTAQPDELCPTILENGRSTQDFDPDWLVVRLVDTAPINPKSIFSRSAFPASNRLVDPQPGNLSTYVRESAAGPTAAVTYADWQLLIYLCRLFDEATALEIARRVAQNTDVEASFAETLQMLA